MYIAADSLDDLLRKVFQGILKRGVHIRPSKGPAIEVQGVSLRLTAPRARLSRTETRGTLFSGIGEWLWYLSGTNDLSFISYYLPRYSEFDEDGMIYGGYGPRIFGRGVDAQIEQIIDILTRKPDSRQAVVQIFDRHDLVKQHKDVPCTCYLQFLLRNNHLSLHAMMRSNDAYIGLPHDVFAFTMIQEIVARRLNARLGDYRHYAGSLHIYDTNRQATTKFLDEGYQTRTLMPRMPNGDPRPAVKRLLKIEQQLRAGSTKPVIQDSLDAYWADLARILEIFALNKDPASSAKIPPIYKKMTSDIYAPYIRKRMHKHPIGNTQPELFERSTEREANAK